MSIVIETRVNTLNNVGLKLDDFLEFATREKTGLEASKVVLQTLVKQIEAQCSFVDKDLQEKKIDLVQCSAAKKAIARCMLVVQNMQSSIENQIVQAAGKINALAMSVKYVKDVFDKENEKLQAQKRADAEHEELVKKLAGDSSSETIRDALMGRPDGVRPVDPLKARREEAAEAETKAVLETIDAPPEPPEKPAKQGKKRKQKVE